MEVPERRALHAAMVRLGEGDRSAFHLVFAALWPVLRDFAERLLGDAGQADDAAQAALLKLFEHADQFDAGRDGLSWALGIAALECRTRRKQRARRGAELSLEVTADLAADAASPEEQLVAAELTGAAALASGTLRPAAVEVLLAAARGERSTAGLAPATFRKRLQRALLRLRTVWRARHGTD